MKIEFSCPFEGIIKDLDTHPYPSKKNIPEWFKKVEPHGPAVQNIKGCLPVRDSITAGYILPLVQDMYIRYGCDDNGEKMTGENSFAITFSHNQNVSLDEERGWLNLSTEEHPARQVGGDGSFYTKKQQMGSICKLLNPWIIKTPPGYSCLFVPPLHREFDKFSILPGIVDTDTFHRTVNFPFVMNKNYLHSKFVVEKGTPVVQIIPFKRDDWNMDIKKIDKKDLKSKDLRFFSKLLHRYRTFNWIKKIWN